MTKPRVPAIIACLFCLAQPVGGARAGDVPPPAKAVAAVDGVPVALEAFRIFLKEKGIDLSGKSPGDREKALREYLVEWQFAREARERGLDRETEILEATEKFDEERLPDLYFREKFLERVEVREEDMLPYYKGLTDTASVRLAVLDTEEGARDFLAKARAGESFEQLIGDHSRGKSANSQGIIPAVTIGDVRFTLEEKEAILSASPGTILGPFENKLGKWSVIRVEKLVSVAEQKKEIRENMLPEIRKSKARTEYLRKVGEEKARLGVDVDDSFFPADADPPKSGPPGDEGGQKRKKPPYVAKIGDRYIFPADLLAGSPHGNPEGKRAKLLRMLEAIAATRLARGERLDLDPRFVAQKEAFLITLLSAATMRAEFARDPGVSREEIKAFHKKTYLPDQYEVYLVTGTDRGKVEEARKKLRAKADPAKIAREYSDDPSRVRGGLLGYLPISSFDPEAQKRIRSLKGGRYSEVFRVQDRYVVLKVASTRKVDVPPLGEVEGEIRKKISLQKRSERVLQKREKALAGRTVEIDRNVLDTL